jgi:hypothetical protein
METSSATPIIESMTSSFERRLRRSCQFSKLPYKGHWQRRPLDPRGGKEVHKMVKFHAATNCC